MNRWKIEKYSCLIMMPFLGVVFLLTRMGFHQLDKPMIIIGVLFVAFLLLIGGKQK